MRVFRDSTIMFVRCMRISFRNPALLGNSIIAPAFLMWVFGSVFGGIMDVGDLNYINFIVPGVIMQSVAQSMQAAAVTVNDDTKKGIIDRFRSMPIAKSSVLIGHVLASVVRSVITTAIIIGVAVIIGFRPQASFTGWLIIAGILVLFMFAITWIAVIGGLLSSTADGAATSIFPMFFLPFLSSGFAPTESMSGWLRVFSENQPMTPIIDAMRAIILDTPPGNSITMAIAWCVGITIVSFVIAVQIYKRKAA
ncbi:MAG: ABC transporter permease [Defluviitaleaceae bacterium]|nr:ABC transporter permease [Defluviitaleaceae bacterium]